MTRLALVTGSGGLVGHAVTQCLITDGWSVVGIDNDSRASYFGDTASIAHSIGLLTLIHGYSHLNIDLTDFDEIKELFNKKSFDLIVHCASQPSHDVASSIVLRDFDVNARATVFLLEMIRQTNKEALFVFMSTNKVYGDVPNRIPVIELQTRYDFIKRYRKGIDESLSVDSCMHSLFGSSKLAADVYVQEYGRYFGMKTAVLRAGCLTGPLHAGVESHGFLSYLIKCAITGSQYTINGFKGKQVRDQLHASDVASIILTIVNDSDKIFGDVFNIGGCYKNSASILELIKLIEENMCRKINVVQSPLARKGDHLVYYTDMTKFKTRFPRWSMLYSLDDIVKEMIDAKVVKNE